MRIQKNKVIFYPSEMSKYVKLRINKAAAFRNEYISLL